MSAEMEDRLRAAAPAPSRPFDLDAAMRAGVRRRHRRTAMRGVALAGVLALAVVTAGNVLPPGVPGVDIAAGPHGAPSEGAAGVDPTVVANAVAPYDAASAVDSRIVSEAVIALSDDEVAACLAQRGFHETPAPRQPVDRETMLWESNAEFPYIEGLEREGFRAPQVPPVEGWDEPAGYGEAVEACTSEVTATESVLLEELGESDVIPSNRADELFSLLRSAWQDVLAEIETTDEIRTATDQVAACADDEGIPRRMHNDDGSPADPALAILGHAEGLKMATDDPDRRAEIDREYGQLYLACGRPLFEARERLRSGERRDAFLTEHAKAIVELSELLTEAAPDEP